jgi:hypothetical protein
MGIWLEKRIVKTLHSHFIRSGKGLARDALKKLIIEPKWPRLNYILTEYRGERFERMINSTLDDCIGGDGKNGGHRYLGYGENDEKNVLFVTTEGRYFLTLPFGFLEEYLKRRKRTVRAALSFVFGFIGALVLWYLTENNNDLSPLRSFLSPFTF